MTDPFLLLDFWQSTPSGITAFDADHPNRYIIFEGVTEGKGQLVMTFWKGTTKIGEGGGAWLDIKNIKKMYQRGRSVPDFTDRPFDHMDSWTAPAISNEAYDMGQSFSKPENEEKKVVIYVHGINGPSGQSDAYGTWIADSETVFKRLWQQGYKGRFATFKWLALTPAWPFKFNESEYRAFKCGRGLAQFINTLPQAGDYKKNLYSFSQGAPVCGAALTVYGASVENYVMSQAAMPAGCYDTSSSINSYADFLNAETTWGPTPDWTNDLGYRSYLTSLNVTSSVVSFYNTSDFALKTGQLGPLNTSWEGNQIQFKPNYTTSRTYEYTPSEPLGQRCSLLDESSFAERPVTDIHESMAFVARPRSEAAGANTTVAGAIDERYNVGPSSPSNFSNAQSEHGGQFSRRIQQTGPYYRELGVRLNVLNLQ